MKILDKLISFLFSVVMLIVAITIVLMVFHLADLGTVVGLIENYVLNVEYQYIVLVVAAVVILGSIKLMIFNADSKNRKKELIEVTTERGRLEITKDAIEMIVKAVISRYKDVKDVQAQMYKKKDGIQIDIVLSIVPGTNIRTLTDELQSNIENTIVNSTGIEVVSINVKVKNVYVTKTKLLNPAIEEVIEKEKIVETKTPVVKEEEKKDEVSEEVLESVNTEEKVEE